MLCLNRWEELGYLWGVLDLYLTLYTRMNSKQIKDLNMANYILKAPK